MPPPAPDAAPGSSATLRSRNERLVWEILRGGPAADADDACGDPAFTQAELARATGLAPATISNIVRELSGRELVSTQAGSGRRGSAVRLSPDVGIVAGIDFGHSHLAVGVATLGGRLIEHRRAPSDEDLDAEQALARAAAMLAELTPGRAPLRQVGLGVPAPLTRGVVASEAVFPGWEGVDIAASAERLLGAAVVVDNDANLGALAEHRLGTARGHGSSVYVKISSGVGAGIVIGDRLFTGSGGTAGELGHLTLDEQGPICRCGSRGCLEAYVSTTTIRGLLAEQLPDASLEQVIDAARAGSTAAQRSLEDAGVHLGWGLASIVNLLNPAVIVIGGDLARAGELVLGGTRRGLRRHALDSMAHTPVLVSSLGAQASLMGAVLLAADEVDLIGEPA